MLGIGICFICRNNFFSLNKNTIEYNLYISLCSKIRHAQISKIEVGHIIKKNIQIKCIFYYIGIE